MTDDRLRKEHHSAGTSLTCPSGKVSFLTRKAARRQARLLEPRYGKMRPYSCPQCGGVHIGHLPRAVREGETTAEEYYSRVVDNLRSTE